MNNKVILKIKAGSHLYGLNTPESDEDYIGVYLSTKDELLGLNHSEILEDNVVSRKENGRNDKDAIDCKYYELRKFCQLAHNNNPTILELFFAPKENIIECTTEGQMLLDSYKDFVCTRVKHSYLGYAFSQKQKSFVKSSNLKKLVETYQSFKDHDYQNSSLKLYNVLEQNEAFKFFYKDENFPDYVCMADLKFTNYTLKRTFEIIEARISRGTARADGMLEKGFDTKFMSHTLRLLYEGLELLETGKLQFPLEHKDFLLKVKKGEIPFSVQLAEIDRLEKKMEILYSASKLPKKPNFDAINNMIINIYTGYLKEKL